MGRIYRRHSGGNWFGDWTNSGGERFRASLRTSDARVAKERLRSAELAATDPATFGPPHTLTESLDYLISVASVDKAPGTRRMFEQKARQLVRVLGGAVDVAHLKREEVARYASQRLLEEASPHTVHKELVTLRRALKESAGRGFKVSPAQVVPAFRAAYQPRETWLTPEQFGLLLARLPSTRKLWAVLAVQTGMRSGELARLEWAHIDLARGRIRVPGRKTAASWRVVPIAPGLRPWLERNRRAVGRVVGTWPNAVRDLAAAAVAVKVPRVTPNDLRRTFASWLVQSGVPILTVSRLLGHSSTRMVEKVYGHLSPEVFRVALAGLPVACDARVPDSAPFLAPNETHDTIPEAHPKKRKPSNTDGDEGFSECPGPESNWGHADFQSDIPRRKRARSR